jgi:hypothetical protein
MERQSAGSPSSEHWSVRAIWLHRDTALGRDPDSGDYAFEVKWSRRFEALGDAAPSNTQPAGRSPSSGSRSVIFQPRRERTSKPPSRATERPEAVELQLVGVSRHSGSAQTG